MKSFIKNIKLEAKKAPARIVFPEAALDDRIIQATAIILKEKTAKPILIGKEIEILKRAKRLGIKLGETPIIDPENSELTEKYVKKFMTLRKKTEREAWETVPKVNYFGTMMVYAGDADGMVSGTTWSTADTVRPALQIIKTKEKFHKVSGFFFMILEKRLLLFADCAITIDPNSHDLVDIATDTAETAKNFGIDPKVAMLSFSTNGSAKHPFVNKVREAIALARDEQPNLKIEGEMQVDAALVPEICEKKFPDSSLKGDANVLIFPDLQSANIAYKLVERLAGAKAIGPILQGLKKPVNDLSRGCSVQDIVDITAITSVEASKN
ncbi:MAG: phosphate acetyltransferase [Patescibacteria group bacterium]|nr:phosphate acetyltransferase [Patescibacteria group bacterium]